MIMNIITCALLLPCIITVATASAADGVDASAAPRPARRAPDFIVIGAVKAGTSAFRTAGRRHPTVDVISVDASYFYETHFFNSNASFQTTWSKGLAWYESLFAAYPPSHVVGEKSPDYLCDPEAAARIHDAYPNVTLVAFVREPVSRAYSHWNMVRRMNECRQLALPSPAASAEPCAGPAACGYFESGLYHRNLKRFADLGMRVRVFVYEELLSRPHETEYDEVFRAIGAPPHASKKRIKGFRNEYETQLSDVPLEWRCAMANAYRDDLELLYGFLGRRIAAWDQAHADCRASPDDGPSVTAIVMGEDSRVQDEFTRAGLPYARLPEPCDAAAGNMTDDECALLKIRHCTHVGPILPGMCGCRGKIGGIAISHLRAWEHALRTRPDARFHFFTEQDVKFHGASDVDGALRAVLDEAFRRAPSWRVIWFSSAKNCEPGPDVTWSKKWLASHSDMPFAKAVTHKIFCGASGLHRWDAQSWEPDPASPILNHQTGAPFSLRRKWTISNVQTESWNVAYALSKRGIRTLVQRARTHGFLEPVDQSMAGTCDDGTCLTHFSNSTFGIVDYESGGQASGSRRPPPSSHPRSRRSPPRKGRSPPLWRRRAARPHSGFTRNPERAGGRAVA